MKNALESDFNRLKVHFVKYSLSILATIETAHLLKPLVIVGVVTWLIDAEEFYAERRFLRDEDDNTNSLRVFENWPV